MNARKSERYLSERMDCNAQSIRDFVHGRLTCVLSFLFPISFSIILVLYSADKQREKDNNAVK